MDIKYFNLATFYAAVVYAFIVFLYSGRYFGETTIIFIFALVAIWGTYFIMRKK